MGDTDTEVVVDVCKWCQTVNPVGGTALGDFGPTEEVYLCELCSATVDHQFVELELMNAICAVANIVRKDIQEANLALITPQKRAT